MATVGVLLHKEMLDSYEMNTQCWELNLVQKLISIILDIENSNHNITIILVTTSNI